MTQTLFGTQPDDMELTSKPIIPRPKQRKIQGDRKKWLLAHRHMDARLLAEYLGVSTSTIYNYLKK